MNKIIFFDFDGVILDSMPIRDYGFKKMVEKYPAELVDKFIEYHRYNAGLSRFHKIRYFYNKLLGEEISEEKIQSYTDKFSQLMKVELINKKYLISETVDYIKKNYQNYRFHIVSGSEQNELRYLCDKLELTPYFSSIYGSPTPKNDLVKNILYQEHYTNDKCILIGDSITDYNAAIANKIEFYGYNNKDLKQYRNYLNNFGELKW